MNALNHSPGHAPGRCAVSQANGTPVRLGRLPNNWRTRLPDPAAYYMEHLGNLASPDADGWAECRCPFNGGRKTKARANVRSGAFKEAVRDLIGLGVRHAS